MLPSPVRLRVENDEGGPQISRHIFGHFAEHLGACVYGGIWVGEDSPIPNVRGIRTDVVEALRGIRAPNLRWPGGCFADNYHWRDGIGPREKRPLRPNRTWGGKETNAFGTHEFLDLCRQVGCEPCICGNVGTGTVAEMRDWLEYLNAPRGSSALADERAANGLPEPANVRFWGVGNESWGCGGVMRPEYYADELRRYSNFLPHPEKGPLFRIATGPAVDDYNWTEVMMRECSAPRFNPTVIDGLSMHYYMNGSPSADIPPPGEFWTTRFNHDDWRRVMALGWHMDHLVRRHSEIMDRHDPKRRIALVVDEWGAWYTTEPGPRPSAYFQQQTIRDAALAALTFDVFIRHAERVRMANLAQAMNVLHAVVLTFGEHAVRTPTWHVFEMYAAHQDATRLKVSSDAATMKHGDWSYPSVSASASRASDGSTCLTITQTDPSESRAIEATLPLAQGAKIRSARILAARALNDVNTPEAPNCVSARPWTDFQFDGQTLRATLPPASVVAVQFE